MNKASIPWTTKQIAKMSDNGSLVFDNAIQRNYVWDIKRKSLLIDSILRGYPIPPFYTIKTERTVTTPKGEVKVFDCLDGKQRCGAIAGFRNNEFALSGLETIECDDSAEFNLNGLYFTDLPEDLKDIFDSYSLTVYGLSEITDEEVCEVMCRLNNGKPLSAIDLTRIKARDLEGIRRMADHPVFKEFLTEKAMESRQNEDIAVKSFAMLDGGNASLDNKDVRFIYENVCFDDFTQCRMFRIFGIMLELNNVLIEMGYKKSAKKIRTKTHFISLIPIIDRALDDGRDMHSFAQFVSGFFEEGSPSSSEAYNTACTNGSNHAGNVSIRNEELMKEYEWFYKI